MVKHIISGNTFPDDGNERHRPAGLSENSLDEGAAASVLGASAVGPMVDRKVPEEWGPMTYGLYMLLKEGLRTAGGGRGDFPH